MVALGLTKIQENQHHKVKLEAHLRHSKYSLHCDEFQSNQVLQTTQLEMRYKLYINEIQF